MQQNSRYNDSKERILHPTCKVTQPVVRGKLLQPTPQDHDPQSIGIMNQMINTSMDGQKVNGSNVNIHNEPSLTTCNFWNDDFRIGISNPGINSCRDYRNNKTCIYGLLFTNNING